MKIDYKAEFGAVTREVLVPEGDGGTSRTVVVSRSYPATVEELWASVTNPKRLERWFTPVEGDLELGGRYQLQGNAGGEIRACEPPSHLALTWEFGDTVSRVEVRFSDDGRGRARITLTHTARVSAHWDTYGPGAAGVGWELAFVGLGLHVANPTAPRPEAAEFFGSPDTRALIRGCSDAWGRAAVASGTDPEVAAAAAKRTTAFYTGEAE